MTAYGMIKTLAVSAVAATALSTVALAGGMKDDAPAGRQLSLSANIGVTSDYVFRGISQSGGDPAVQGGVDVGYGIFYLGAWASTIDFGNVADAELDLYTGIKPTWGPLSFDFGVIYYLYPGANDGGGTGVNEQDYVELKAGVSGSPIANLTLGTTVYYSPDYNAESGNTWTVEGLAAYELPKVGPFTPTLSSTLGTTIFENTASARTFNTGIDGDNYLYWNAGLSLGVDKLTFDFRYWDSDIDTGCSGTTFQCDERFVASAKLTLP